MTGESVINAISKPSDEVVEIRPHRRWAPLNLREFWSYRDLLRETVAKDLRARYKQSLIGKAWVIVQPLALMLIYYTIFGLVLQLKTGEVPFPVFLLGGVLIWQLIAACVSNISSSLVGNAHLMSKVYFPRLLLPLSQTLTALVDFGFGFVVLLGFMAVLGVWPPIQAVLTPLFVLAAVLAGIAAGLWLAPLNVKYRDVGQAIPLLLQVFMYASPVFYSPDFVPENWRWLYDLNPGAGIVQGFRWSLMGDSPPGPTAWVGLAAVAVMFVGGLFFFRSREASFVDSL